MSIRIVVAAVAAAAVSSSIVLAQAQPDQALVTRARAIHDRTITMDTHVDISTARFTPACNYTMRLTTQVNFPKMREGGLNAPWLIVYTGQGALTPEGFGGAYQQAIEKFDAIHRLTKEIAPNQMELALTPSDVVRIRKAGKFAAMIGIENGYPVGTDISRVKEFFDRGGRYMSLAHNGNSQLADSNSTEAANGGIHGGLSELGKQVIAEMNKWGMMVDVSHPSKQANMQTIALSQAPVIASHSSARALANHTRNMDDELLLALKKNGGVMQTVAFATYVKVDEHGPARQAAVQALGQEFGLAAGGGRGGGGARGGGRGAAATGQPVCPVETDAPAGTAPTAAGRGGANQAALEALPDDRRAEYTRRLTEINTKYPAMERATVADFVDHIDYAVKLIGIDHVGIS
ncbi:MAG: membrane dipeptidase, partial [Acidobacteria bacterium]|nr:membrane dipeptidase [Acidobacteriota bacterium]